MGHIKLKKIFLITLIIALSIGALIGIFIFIFGSFGEIERKLLVTTLSIGGFSLTALCASIWYERKKFLFVSFPGIIASVLGLIYSLLLIWEIIDTHPFDNVKPLLILIILSLALAYSSLMLLGYKKKRLLLAGVVLVTILEVIIISLMLIGWIIWEWKLEEQFFRTLGVLGILAALGTLVTPILNKINLLNERK